MNLLKSEDVKLFENPLNDSVRMAWFSLDSKKNWDLKLKELISFNKITLKMLLIKSGHAKCSLTFLTGTELLEVFEKSTYFNLQCTPIEYDDQNNTHLVLISPAEVISEFKKYWVNQEEKLIMSLLGYPKCCSESNRKLLDAGYQYLESASLISTKFVKNGKIDQKDLKYSHNCLLKNFGLSFYNHIPCDLDCKETEKIFEDLVNTSREFGYSEKIQDMIDFFSKKFDYSVNNGIFEYENNILKVLGKSDKHNIKISIHENIPSPVSNLNQLIDNESDYDIEDFNNLGQNYYSDNGFKTKYQMDETFEEFSSYIIDQIDCNVKHIYDLTCRNGVLLKKIGFGKQLNLVGFDNNADIVNRANTVLGAHGKAYTTNYENFLQIKPEKNSLCYFNARLIYEFDSRETKKLIRHVTDYFDKVIVYLFNDWLDQHNSIAEFALINGFKVNGNNHIGVLKV